MQRSKNDGYSITSSARESSVGGTAAITGDAHWGGNWWRFVIIPHCHAVSR